MKERTNQSNENDSKLVDQNPEQNSNNVELPNDIMNLVFSYLPAKDLTRITKVCKKWKELSCKNEIWKNECIKVGISIEPTINTSTNNYYKGLFADYYNPNNYSNRDKKTYYITLTDALEKPTLKMRLKMHSKHTIYASMSRAKDGLEHKKNSSGYNIIYEVKLSDEEFKQLEPEHVHRGALVNYYSVTAEYKKCPIVTVINTYYKLATDDYHKPYISVKPPHSQNNSNKDQNNDKSGCRIS